MKRAITFWIIGSTFILPSLAFADLFNGLKTDSNVKPLVFPQSLVVIPQCVHHEDGSNCLMLRSGFHRIHESYKKESMGLELSDMDRIFTDLKVTRRILKKIDPARITPVVMGEPPGKVITRDVLRLLGKKYDVDIILAIRSVFRRFTQHPDGGPAVYTEGIIYLVRQDKIIGRPFGEQEITLKSSEMEKRMKENFKMILKELAKDARKIIMSHKYEKRRSNY